MNNLMDLLRKVLFGILMVAVYFFLLGTSYDLLTKPNTLSNFLGFIGVTLLLILGMVFIYNGIKIMIESSNNREISEAEQKWKEHVEMQMQKMHEQNEALKNKTKRKPKTK
jgi:putative Mn2+ efflux pump MntP